ncbi:PAS domain-containing protein [Cellulomonas sp. ACRRI]|uniref:helix-turn-helix transcriptional regulator n=1 Tax=Cellulomonas sp. ACRRI TaxID=2918188 RepID=UPI001EF298CE|nr:PAS domain-containing protein [Cellulomonas sp. ACRRI]MCG7284875.1 PAS domain-containing protein [Cellulomonas sp. ACRRI]
MTSGNSAASASGEQDLAAPQDPGALEPAALMRLLGQVVESVGSALPRTIEVVLHDLARLPDSIVAVSGDVTHRVVGDPATDVLLRAVVDGSTDRLTGYETRLDDGRLVRSSTLIVRDGAGAAVAALCVNADVTAWERLRTLADEVLAPRGGATAPREAVGQGDAPPAEKFATDVDELAAHLVRQAIADVGVPVTLMKKEHKLAVVAELRARGMFLLRDAVEMVATSLHVSRFTIYNYLNELDQSGRAADD